MNIPYAWCRNGSCKALRTHPECNVSAIAKKYDVDKKHIREWDKQFDKLLD